MKNSKYYAIACGKPVAIRVSTSFDELWQAWLATPSKDQLRFKKSDSLDELSRLMGAEYDTQFKRAVRVMRKAIR